MSTSRPGRARRIALRVALSLVVVVASAGALELALRRDWIQNGRYARFHAVPDERVREAARDPEVLVLGDSFAVPLGGFGRRLAEDLAADGIGVLDTATGGTGPFEYLDELEGAIGAGPELVLLSYYVGNDLTDVQNHPRYEGRDPSLAAVAIDRSSSRPLLNRLYLYHYLRTQWNRLRARFLDTSELVEAGVDPELAADARALRINPWLARQAVQNPSLLLDNLLRESEDNANAWERTRELLDRMREVCVAHGARLAVVAMPHTLQVDDSHVDFFRRLAYRLDPRVRESARPQEELRLWCQERGVPLLDLLPDLRAAASEPLYLEKDDHLSPAGNRIAATRTAAFVRQQLGRRP